VLKQPDKHNIAKPLILEELATLLKEWTAPDCTNGCASNLKEPSPERPPALPEESAEILDRELLATFRRVKVSGAANLLCQLVDIFLADLPPRLDSMKISLAAGDPTTFRAAAHALKGSCGSVGAKRMLALLRGA
jgi:Hpt domain